RIVALSQGYGVMSRETSLLVLESQAMFDAFGVDRSSPAPMWTGEEEIDEVATSGTLQVPADIAPPGKVAAAPRASARDVMVDADDEAPASAGFFPPGGADGRADTDAKSKMPARRRLPPGGRRMMIPMKRVWTRQAALATFDGTSASIIKAIENAQDALEKNPDSREKHRALVQALSYAGKL